jgi:hypothetical protein
MEGGGFDPFVQRVHGRGRAAVERADDDLGRGEVVGDRAGFAQEFGVVDQLHCARAIVAQGGAKDRQDQLLGGAWAHRRAVGDGKRLRAIRRDRRRDVARDLRDVAHVVRAIDTARRTDADDREVRGVERIADFQPRLQAPVGARIGNQVVQPRLVHRRAAGVDRVDLALADIDADDAVALARDTACSCAPDIAETEDDYLQMPFRPAPRVLGRGLTARPRRCNKG